MLCMLCMYGKTGQHVFSFTGRFIESDASKNFSREAPAKEKSHLQHEDKIQFDLQNLSDLHGLNWLDLRSIQLKRRCVESFPVR